MGSWRCSSPWSCGTGPEPAARPFTFSLPLMKRLIAFVLAAAGSFNLFAQAPQPPEVAARQYILMDLSGNRVLAEREADAPSDPASLTKLMTAYLVFQALKD